MNELLQKAINCLEIQDIYMKSSSSSLAEGPGPKYINENDLNSELKHKVIQCEIMTLNYKENSDMKIFRVLIDFEARWVIHYDVSGKENNVDELDIRANIGASFLAEYLLKNNPGQDALNEFALKNAIYHIWPYWREYLMSQCARMNLPKVTVPAVQFAHSNKDTGYSIGEKKDEVDES